MSNQLPRPDLILVGCLKKKRSHGAPARDLYDSTLWRWRRGYAEASGCLWYILSAKHGLLAPDVEIAPYDLALSDLTVAERRAWSQRVLRDIESTSSALAGKIVEIHAGKEYVKYGLVDGLSEARAVVHRPLAHVGLFQQPRWYSEQLTLGSSKSERGSTSSELDVSRAAQLAEKVANEFYGAGLDLSSRGMEQSGTWSRMPEVECTEQLRASEVPDRDIRLFLTFITALDRARDAMSLWHNGLRMFRSRPEMFEPARMAAIPIDIIRETLASYRVSQRHGPDSEAWSTIASSLASGDGPVSRAIEGGVGDAHELLRELQSKSAGKNRFPQLRGPKIGPMWVRILAAPGGATISNIDTIPVAVDVHIKRVTENLGVTDTGELSVGKAKPIIHSAWREAIAAARIGGPPGIAGTCAALDPALWIFGKYGCSVCERRNKLMPISPACKGCHLQVSSK